MSSAVWVIGILALAAIGRGARGRMTPPAQKPPKRRGVDAPARGVDARAEPAPKSPKRLGVDAATQKKLEDMITAEALRQGVPPSVALATAWIESRMDPNAEGDKWWHEDPQRFEAVPKDHPDRWNRKLWHSYGLFQLLAAYHVSKTEHPEILLSPQLNIERGVRKLAKLLLRYGTNLDKVRLAYTGARTTNQTNIEATLQRWHAALRKYGYDEPRP